MGDIRKVGGEYYVEFMARGLKYQQRAGVDRKSAQKLLDEIERKISIGEMGTVVRDADIDIFVVDFLTSLKKDHSSKTRKRFKLVVGRFHDFVKAKPFQLTKLSQLTPSVFEQYKNSLLKKEHAAPQGVNLALVLLSEFCEYARKTGYLNDNPLLHIKFVPAVYRRLGYLNQHELKLLFSVLPVKLKQGHEFDLEIFRKTLLKIKANVKFRNELEKKMGDLFTGKKINVKDLEHTFAFYALKRNISLVNLSLLMGKDDIAQVMVYFPLLNLAGGDVLSSSVHSVR